VCLARRLLIKHHGAMGSCSTAMFANAFWCGKMCIKWGWGGVCFVVPARHPREAEAGGQYDSSTAWAT
jgi:hypothetical protein